MFYRCVSVHGRVIPACISGGIPACLAAGLRGGGGIPACLAGFQAHSQGGSLGGSGPGPHPRGKMRGIWPGGGSVSSLGRWSPPPLCDSCCCERYASYWNTFLFHLHLYYCKRDPVQWGFNSSGEIVFFWIIWYRLYLKYSVYVSVCPLLTTGQEMTGLTKQHP